MTLVRWNPWREMSALQRQMNQLFEDTITPAKLFDSSFAHIPAVEIQETDDAILLKMEVPGMDSKDLDIQVSETTVHISGERKHEANQEEDGFRKSEFYYGKFERTIPLGIRIQNTEVKAEYKDGILSLTLPKAEAEKNKVVKVSL
ncbi:Hsp20/alpha crystallin family protein [Calothrix sp. NIES-3974]|uniref:Hsp20/alpha crystallin family protein n=1 Tax=Calothrix sp. NIES-3974 TaxID=2005462 RepID=UPI000B60E216|nr:Hsp20/alpha crystallin family protein [Calothrix sp. NIES-3974]BAZ06667.1 heat shock protein Hsp20 [Calothrix sp. NIES-3974]